MGTTIVAFKGDTGSLDNGSFGVPRIAVKGPAVSTLRVYKDYGKSWTLKPCCSRLPS